MTYVQTTMPYQRTNVFWVAANILFDMNTGKRTDVLMLVSRETDATIFNTEQEATGYLAFIQHRAQHIQWFLDAPTPQRPLGWVIRGVQTVTLGA